MRKVDKSMVGETVYLKTVGNAARGGVSIKETRIVSVGRKYFEVGEEKGGRFNIKFHLEDNRQFTDYSADWEIYFSRQEIYDEEESEKIESELRMKFGSWGKTDLSLDQLRRIKEIVNE